MSVPGVLISVGPLGPHKSQADMAPPVIRALKRWLHVHKDSISSFLRHFHDSCLDDQVSPTSILLRVSSCSHSFLIITLTDVESCLVSLHTSYWCLHFVHSTFVIKTLVSHFLYQKNPAISSHHCWHIWEANGLHYVSMRKVPKHVPEFRILWIS